ncbi:ABC transporter ATP-binding protein [Microbacterium oxydans]|nr:ABC transporter ATP-binding protein [Microbacterium oxydans]
MIWRSAKATTRFGSSPASASWWTAAASSSGSSGESGSGKSTTARAALALYGDEATIAGSIRVDGTQMVAADEKTRRRVRSESVSLVQQDPRSALNPVRRIGDSLAERLVRVHGWRRGRAEAHIVQLLAAVGLTHPERRMRQYPHELSGGMLQRVVIASALSTDPALLLADEATSALDVTTQAEIIAIFQRQIRDRGLGMLFITHDLALAARSAIGSMSCARARSSRRSRSRGSSRTRFIRIRSR